jgi:hypothetical protein
MPNRLARLRNVVIVVSFSDEREELPVNLRRLHLPERQTLLQSSHCCALHFGSDFLGQGTAVTRGNWDDFVGILGDCLCHVHSSMRVMTNRLNVPVF